MRAAVSEEPAHPGAQVPRSWAAGQTTKQRCLRGSQANSPSPEADSMPWEDLANQGALAIREAVLPELRPHSMMSQEVTRMCRSVSLPLFRDTPVSYTHLTLPTKRIV